MEIGKQEKKELYNFTNGEEFMSICQKKPVSFIDEATSISYFDLDKLVTIIETGNIKGIYEIARGFEYFYKSGDFYTEELSKLKTFLEKIKKVSYKGRTRIRAVGVLCDTIENISTKL